MSLVESERLEIKSCVTSKICKTIVAFLNTLGGSIYIGIDDFGTSVGVEDIDAEMLRLSNLVHDCIRPHAPELVEITPVEHDGKQLIKVDVEPGDEKPYYLASKGLVPSGVFTRLGPATIPMDRRDIRRLIRHADGFAFEDEHCREQDLTFEVAQRVFGNHGIPFDTATLNGLGIIGSDGFYTNLGLLVSDQNPFEFKCALFNDDALTELINRRDCTSSIFKQLEEAESFISTANGLRSYFVPGQIERIDKYDYPALAIREGVLNAIIHRDYDPRTPTLIKMNRTELQIINFGGLCSLSIDQVRSGMSAARNPRLRQLMYRLGIVEALGTGLGRIFASYESEGLTPTIASENNWFNLTLPNINTSRNPHLSLRENNGPDLRGDYDDYEKLYTAAMLPPDVARAFEPRRAEHRARLRESLRITTLPATHTDGYTVEHALIEFGRKNGGSFSRQEAEEALGAGRDVTLKVINGLVEDGELVKEGKARATRYRVAG